jgi:hypothetical protein
MENESKVIKKFSTLKEYLTPRQLLKILAGIVIGGLSGFLYYYFIGCNSGTCPITSNPYNSILAGNLFGLIIAF